jgi:hypothetical protein
MQHCSHCGLIASCHLCYGCANTFRSSSFCSQGRPTSQCVSVLLQARLSLTQVQVAPFMPADMITKYYLIHFQLCVVPADDSDVWLITWSHIIVSPSHLFGPSCRLLEKAVVPLDFSPHAKSGGTSCVHHDHGMAVSSFFLGALLIHNVWRLPPCCY